MKNVLITCLVILSLQTSAQIKLIVRADDMGSCRAANLAIIDSYKNGIATTTEVMAPCPWFLDAATMLKSVPGLDVGLHMVLTSEWLYYKWRPLTSGKSIQDNDGYFNQMVWSGGLSSLSNVKLDMAEVEAEFRAQISLALKKIPQITHISEHMYFGDLKPELSVLIKKLAGEYHLGVESDLNTLGVKAFTFPDGPDFEANKAIFIANLKALTPGTYHFLAHPCVESIELSQMVTDYTPSPGETNRIVVYKLFTDPDVMQAIKDKGIELIGYKDLMMSTPTTPNLMSPADSAVLHTTFYNFEWSVSTPSIEKYQIELSSSKDFATAITDSSIIGTKITLNRTQIPKTRNFFWRIRAKNSMGWSTYSKTFQIVNTYVAAVSHVKVMDEFKVYFNSADNTLNAILPKQTNDTYIVSVTDLNGKTLLSKSVNDENGNIKVKTGSLKTGVYIISATNSKSKFNQKIVIE